MMGAVRALPDFAEVTQLVAAPRRRVPEELADGNGHMNVRHYLAILDDAEWTTFDAFDAGSAAAEAGTGGMFALEQLLTYRHEVLVGAEVQVHLRLLEHDGRMLHLVSYLVDHTHDRVAASMESLEAYVDHSTRRIAPFPDRAVRELDRIVAAHAALDWRPELSGAIALPPRRSS